MRRRNNIVNSFNLHYPKQVLVPFWLLAFMLLTNACIEVYEPDIEEKYELVSIEGSLVKGEEEQTLIVSTTATLEYPQFNPIYGCIIAIVDDQDNHYYYSENENGTYSLRIPDNLLVFGRKYQLQVSTPSGEIYESQFEPMVSGAEVDTFYYEIEDYLDNISGEALMGLQFYVDLKAPDTISRYFRWNIEETYEYTSVSPISFYWTELGASEEPKDDMEFYRCWSTAPVRKLFLSNTTNLIENEKKRIPLQFVTNRTDRLKYKYSPLVKQYTLSEEAYSYWQKAKNELQEGSGLYTQQPGKSISNLRNVSDSTEEVLGYFWVSHMTEKRIFVPRPDNLEIIGDQCYLIPYDPLKHVNGPFPRFFWDDQVREVLFTGPQGCLNCTFKGGENTPPDFWQ